MMNIKVLGIDLAKNVFQLHGVDAEGKVVLKRRLIRSELSEFIAKLPACLIGIEACSSSNYWGELAAEINNVLLFAVAAVKTIGISNRQGS